MAESVRRLYEARPRYIVLNLPMQEGGEIAPGTFTDLRWLRAFRSNDGHQFCEVLAQGVGLGGVPFDIVLTVRLTGSQAPPELPRLASVDLVGLSALSYSSATKSNGLALRAQGVAL